MLSRFLGLQILEGQPTVVQGTLVRTRTGERGHGILEVVVVELGDDSLPDRLLYLEPMGVVRALIVDHRRIR
jgi:hypothetical protein